MANSQASRPTLPSIHTLDLPMPNIREKMIFYDPHNSYDHRMPKTIQVHSHNRQTSISSSITDDSRSSMFPPPLDLSVSTTLSALRIHNPPSLAPIETCRLRLVRSSFENADAVLVIPPPTLPHIPPLSSTATSSNPAGQVQALLLVGSAMHQHLRHLQRNLARGARIHPYRIIRADHSTKSS